MTDDINFDTENAIACIERLQELLQDDNAKFQDILGNLHLLRKLVVDIGFYAFRKHLDRALIQGYDLFNL